MNISVIVITHNNFSTIKNCLASIESQLSDNDQLIVLDNNSTDGTYKLLQDNPNIDFLIKEKNNLGISNGRNKAASYAKNDYLFFVDSDMIIHDGSIEALKKYNNDIIIGIYYNFGKGLVWYRELKSKYLSQKNLIKLEQVTLENFYTMSGGFSAIKTDVFNELNGFDCFFDNATMEDIDFEIRALNKNKSIIITSDILGSHYKDELNRKKFFSWCVSCGKGNARLFFKARKNSAKLPKTKYYPRFPLFCTLNFFGICFSILLTIFHTQIGLLSLILSLTLYYFNFANLFKLSKKNKRKALLATLLLYMDDIITSISIIKETFKLYIKESDITQNE